MIVDRSLFDQREELIADFNELNIRRKFLLFNHDEFAKKLQETEKRLGLQLRGRIWSGPVYDFGGPNQVMRTGNPLDMTGFNVLWKRTWQGLDDAAKAFLRRYDLLPFSLEDLEYQYGKLITLSKAGGWTLKATSFWRHTHWYELSQEGMTEYKIVKYSAEREPVHIDSNVLSILRSEKDDYHRLCKLAGVSGTRLDEKTAKNLLITLGRLWIEEAKADYNRSIVKGQQYYVHTDMKFPKRVFNKKPPKPRTKSILKILEEFLRQREIYLEKGGQAEKTIEKELRRMKNRIENLYQAYN